MNDDDLRRLGQNAKEHARLYMRVWKPHYDLFVDAGFTDEVAREEARSAVAMWMTRMDFQQEPEEEDGPEWDRGPEWGEL